MSAFSGKVGLSRGGLRPWTPNDLTVKPYLWYDASSATTITLSGSSFVTAVTNLGTASATLTGTGSITNSVTQNGLKTFGIDNTSQTQVLTNTSISMTGTTSTSFSAHLNNPSASGRIIYGRVWSFNGGTGIQDYNVDSGFALLWFSTTNFYYFRNNAGIGPSSSGITNTWLVAGTRRNGTAVITQVNGGTRSTGSTASGAYAATQVRIGNDQNAADSGMRGNVGEQLHFNYSLTDADFDRVTGYLAWKWGLQGSLAATHPYKNGVPYNETPPDYTVNIVTTSTNTNVFLLKANSGNTFSDVGGNALAISKETTTVNYSTTIPFATSALNSANFGTGTGFLKPALNSIFAFGTGNWTFECFINLTARPTSSGLTPLFDTEANANGGRPDSVIIYLNATGRCEVYQNGAARVTSGANVVALNTWTHVAVARNGSTTTIYFNGTSVGSASITWDSMAGNNGNLGVVNNIGTASSQYGISGLMSNARVTKGTAVYTANFTTPTADLSAN